MLPDAPTLTLRDIVFWHVIAPLFVGRKKSILALEEKASTLTAH